MLLTLDCTTYFIISPHASHLPHAPHMSRYPFLQCFAPALLLVVEYCSRPLQHCYLRPHTLLHVFYIPHWMLSSLHCLGCDVESECWGWGRGSCIPMYRRRWWTCRFIGVDVRICIVICHDRCVDGCWLVKMYIYYADISASIFNYEVLEKSSEAAFT